MTDVSVVQADTAKVDAAFEAVVAAFALRGVAVARLASPTSNVLAIELNGTHQWKVYVDCAEEHLQLPTVTTDPPASLLAHVSYGGYVCIDDEQGLSLDPKRPADIVAHVAMKAYDLLENSAADASSGYTEFFNELEGYWLGLPRSVRGRAYFEIDGASRLLKGFPDLGLKKPTWYFLERDAKLPWEVEKNKLEAHRTLYVHLDQIGLPPVKPGELTAAFIADVLQRMSPEQLALWDKLVGASKNSPKRLALLVSVPRQAGGRSLVGVSFTASRGIVDPKGPVTPLTMRRRTPAFMRERGGASLELLNKHIAVLGVGAVGSVVVDTLAAAGVGKLTVVDPDEYAADNVFRHVLDPMYIDLDKPTALKMALGLRYPGLNVIAVPTAAQTWLKTADLNQYDGIVLAFGSPSIERSFSRALKGRELDLPVVFTWLEALDLGGHSLLMWTKGEGCLNCAYRDDEGQPSLASRTAFLEPNQPVTRNLTGCSGAFVPYGALQSRRTGLMAAEHILSAMSAVDGGAVARQPSYKFWVGEGKAAAEQGLRTTPWFRLARTTSEEIATRQVFGRPCPHCRTRKEPAP
ncbi:hypothetical protein DAI18_00875 [Microvirgula aerodenitrificans]|uniref:THIF-type NAD/FAD binding fold domain-containing protein n=1 Tax=Microvirgula aerodenitrificans TaxID=57480 RepID=A0A2U3TH78_9NEIS|nr:ThiF family adenylyltransferase [Microvirgula aerodenitrificans]AVY92760.1 hypothetical protein DAI18_00875 [Microvirgula aerodenitrificans]